MRIDPIATLLGGAAKAARPAVQVQDRAGFDTALRQALTTHQVRPGDTLSEVVAQRLQRLGRDTSAAAIYNGVAKVANANGIGNADFIRVGQRIDLSPLGSLSQPAAGAAPAIASAPQNVTTAAASATQVPAAAPETNRTPVRYAVDVPMPPPQHPPVAFQAPLASVVAPIAVTVAQAAATPPPPLARTAESAAVTQPIARAIAVSETAGKETPAIRLAAARSESTAESHRPWSSVLGGPARLTSEFGPRHDPFNGRVRDHHGVDLAATRGTPVYPIAAGRVTFSGWNRTYGNHVIVSHGDGLETLYGHQQRNHVDEGDRVNGSTPLGAVGSTGRATAPHLHLEVHRGGEPVDPVPFVTGRVPLPGIQSAGP